MNQSLRRFLIALLLAVGVYGAFVVYTGMKALSGALADFTWISFAFALCLSSFNYCLRFLKWEFYLARLGIRHVGRVDSFLIFLSGFVFTVTPGKLGEVFKSAVLFETHKVDIARTAPIVVAERLTDVIAIVVLVVVGSLGFSGGLVWAAAGIIAIGIGLLFILWSRPLAMLIVWMSTKPGRLASLAPRLATAQKSLVAIASPEALLLPTLLSLIGWGGEGLALRLLLDGFGEQTSTMLALFFYATATLAGALVPVPGGLGVAEGIMHSQLIELGHVNAGAATGSMLMIRFATLWWAVIVGFTALSLLRRRYPTLLRSPSAKIG